MSTWWLVSQWLEFETSKSSNWSPTRSVKAGDNWCVDSRLSARRSCEKPPTFLLIDLVGKGEKLFVSFFAMFAGSLKRTLEQYSVSRRGEPGAGGSALETSGKGKMDSMLSTWLGIFCADSKLIDSLTFCRSARKLMAEILFVRVHCINGRTCKLGAFQRIQGIPKEVRIREALS